MADNDAAETVFQFTLCPRWLDYSGLAQVIAKGKKQARWSLYRAVIEADHVTERLEERRHGKGNRTFAWPNEDLAAATGVGVKTVGRLAEELKALGLLEKYKSGKGRSWSHFQVNREPLRDLFCYVAPMLRKIHGGIQNAEQGDKSLNKRQIYGVGNGVVEPVVIDEVGMLRLWKARTEKPELPDLEEVRRICRL